MSIFKLPDLGEGLPDAEIVEWHVKVGDKVSVDEPMVSMETAKAVVDVPVPVDGVVKKLYGQPGDVIDTGLPLIEFTVDETENTSLVTDDEINETDTPEKLRREAEQVLSELNGEEETDTNKSKSIGTVVGQMESSDKVVDNFKTIAGKKVAPAVRALAKKLKVDLSTVEATGAGGVVRPSDVKNAANSPIKANKEIPTTLPLTEPVQTKTVTEPTPQQKSPQTHKMTDEWLQVKGSRRTMARVMSNAHQQVVPTTIMDDADIHAWAPGEDITVRLIRSLVVGAKTEPALNAWFDGEKLAKRLLSHVDIGIAVDTPDGLFVPTMRNCDAMSAKQVRAAMDKIKVQVKNRSIPAEDMKDFTIMLSNFGIYAGRYATPVITPPCVSIMAAGKLRHEVVPVMGGMEVHRIIPLSLCFDHRASTGGEAARFLAAVIKDLGLPK